MKPFIAIAFCLCFLICCKKEINRSSSLYLSRVEESLKDSLDQSTYAKLDFSRVVLSKVDSADLFVLRIPYKSESPRSDFIALRTSAAGRILAGTLVHLEGKNVEQTEGERKRQSFEGMISLSSLDGRNRMTSEIYNGYIQVYHAKTLTRTTSMQAPDVLPEVIVVAYVHDSGLSFSDLMLLQSFFFDSGDRGDSNISNYYTSLDGGYGGNGMYVGGGGAGNGGITMDDPVLIDVDTYADHPAINITDYLKCFDNIPDVGATCSIEILTDIPVDNDPTKLFDWKTESPGHTFLQLRKSNGNQFALQNIGFYPKSNWKEVLNADPVDSKFVDDGGHEFNASLKMSLTPFQLKEIINKIRSMAPGLKYDTDEFNCTDFALEIFNYVRTPLEIPRYSVPGGIGTNATRTPQGLYVKLKQMKDGRDSEANNISIGFLKAWVTSSDGPCF
ncbi:MAG: hypothetical protein ACJ75B_01720 [Flavisolibacter sp.]